jgi:poly(3-hydroxybutyrate) depolymerase
MSISSETDAAITSLYTWLEMQHAAFAPLRAMLGGTQSFLDTPLNPFGQTLFARSISATCALLERATRRYEKPAWNINATNDSGEKIAVEPIVVWRQPFCKLVHFERAASRLYPKILIVAPMSGHHATLLRGTVERLLANHDVYITDWVDARMVPLSEGLFDLDDYIDYVIAMLHHLGDDTHVIAICQPAVPVLAAVSLMEDDNDPSVPLSVTLMGGPIDPSANPTAVNRLAHRNGIEWFARHAIHIVPAPYPGAGRRVYPGFAQLAGFLGLNFDRHIGAHRALFMNLVRGDDESATRHRDFYDEYFAVMDITAEFYLQTVDTIFIRHALAEGQMLHRGRLVRPDRVRHVALLTVEGEKDDITGLGQTQAAHRLCSAIPTDWKMHHVQEGVGHYGVFNGARFRAEIAPRIAQFVRSHSAPRSQRRWTGNFSAVSGCDNPRKNGGKANRHESKLHPQQYRQRCLPRQFSKGFWPRICAAMGVGDEQVVFRWFDEPGGDAKNPGERTASSYICTNGRKTLVALEHYVGMIGFRSPPGLATPDHPGPAFPDPDASRSFAERDNGGTARHGLRDPGNSFGSAGQPRVASDAGRPRHSLRCNRFGRDRSSDR